MERIDIKIAETMRTKEAASRLACGEFDGPNAGLLVSTSYPDDAATIRSIAFDRGISAHVKVLEYDDVENPKRPTSYNNKLAREAVAFMQKLADSDRECTFACDGAFSRSAALAAAAARLSGKGDLEYWSDPESFAPNILVYRLTLSAAGFDLTDEQAANLANLKEAVLEYKIKKSREESGVVICASSLALSPKEQAVMRALWDLEPSNVRLPTVSEITEKARLPMTSTYNVLRSLQDRGLVERCADGTRRLTISGIVAARKSCEHESKEAYRPESSKPLGNSDAS